MDTTDLRTALVAAGIPESAIEPDSRWCEGVWIDNTGPLAVSRDGFGAAADETIVGEDRHGNVITYSTLDGAAASLAILFWVDRRVPSGTAAKFLPIYRRARAWRPEWSAGEAWRQIIDAGWRRHTVTDTDVRAALDFPHEVPSEDQPVALSVSVEADEATITPIALVSDQNGYMVLGAQPSRGRAIPVPDLIDIGARQASREEMVSAVRDHVLAAGREVRDAAFEVLRTRWTSREQVTTEEAAAICGVSASTFRGYANRFGAPKPLPWWARGRDVKGSLYDAVQVQSWWAARPGQGARTDLTAHRNGDQLVARAETRD